MNSYDNAYYTIQDIRDAEERTRGIIGHDDIMSRLESMISYGVVELPWFRFTDCERDLISDYSGIKPRFRIPTPDPPCQSPCIPTCCDDCPVPSESDLPTPPREPQEIYAEYLKRTRGENDPEYMNFLKEFVR